MIKSTTLLSALALTSVAISQAPTMKVSLGIRETGSTAAIGADGGVSGGIEFIDKDTQVLTLDGTWQQFTFHLDPADPLASPVTAFAGATADGLITGTAGTIEHIRLLNDQGITDPIQLWIDDVADTITPPMGSPTTTVFGTFEGYADGTEVMFQEPTFSGSTSGGIVAGGTGGTDNYVASRAFGAQRFDFQFIDNTPTRWLRLTTYVVATQGNPTIAFDQGSVVSFWMRGGKCQPNLGSQGPGTAIAEICGTGLNAGEQSSYYIAGTPPSAPGVLAISLNGGVDVPFAGGNLVSFTGFLFTQGLVTDANGELSIPLMGNAVPGDVVFQSAFLDLSLANVPPLTFTNAVNALIGQ